MNCKRANDLNHSKSVVVVDNVSDKKLKANPDDNCYFCLRMSVCKHEKHTNQYI